MTYDSIENEVWREINLWKDREGHYERLASLIPELLHELDEARYCSQDWRNDEHT